MDQKISRKPEVSFRCLSLLYLKDSPATAELCLQDLKEAGFDLSVDQVSTREEFREKLRSRAYDIILSDYDLRNWSGIDALKVVQKYAIDTPFIFVNGAIEDDTKLAFLEQSPGLFENLRLRESRSVIAGHLGIGANFERHGQIFERRHPRRPGRPVGRDGADQASIARQQIEALCEDGAADRVEDDIDAVLAGPIAHGGGDVLVAIEEDAVGAQTLGDSGLGLGADRRGDARAADFGELNGDVAEAAGPAVDQSELARF